MEENFYQIQINYYCDPSEVDDGLILDRLPEVLNSLEYSVYKEIGEGYFQIKKIINPKGSTISTILHSNTPTRKSVIKI